MMKNWQLEFGDFEKGVEDMNFNDDCVEFPSSWPSQGTHHLSFTVPSIDIQTPTSSLTTQSKDKKANSTVKEQSVSVEQNLVACNGISDENAKTLSNKTVNHEPSSYMNGCETPSHEDIKHRITPKTNLDESSKNIEEIPEFLTATNTTDAINDKDLNVETSLKDNVDITTQSVSDNKTDTDIQRNDNNDNVERTKNANFIDDRSSSNDKLSPEVNETSVTEELKSSTQSSWASLFHKNPTPINTTAPVTSKIVLVNEHPKNTCNKSGSTETIAQTEKQLDSKKPVANKDKVKPTTVELVGPENDPNALYLAEKLLNMDLIFKPQAFMPRGLINTSNWCYINATLQALLVCPPFYQLLKSLPSVSLEKRKKTSTPIIDSFVQLASEFRPLSTKRGYQSNKEVRHGASFEPRYIYDMLALIKSSLSQRGSQEDAEEFQSCVLNGLHDEMARLFKHFNKSSSPLNREKDSVNEGRPNSITDDLMNGDGKALDEWEEVVTTKRNRSAVTRRADVSKTPISDMFRGELCTSVFRPGQKASVSYEPFFSLPLDVSSDHPWSIEDALHVLTDKENFSGTATELDAMRQQSIETLPPVLVLHLKRFVYNKNGGSKKIDKRIDYHTDLVIRKELLSKQSRKLSQAQRSYKLFAVVYHHGEKATGGHYTTDVFHIGLSMWLRIDDQSISAVHHNEVTRHNPNRTAYILYYRRTDLG